MPDAKPGLTSVTDLARRLEDSLLEAYRARDATRLERLLAPEFREISVQGTVVSRADVFAGLAHVPAQGFEITAFEAFAPGPDAIVSLYRVLARRPDREVPSESWRTSWWQRLGPDWHLVLHQATRVPPPPPTSLTAQPSA